MRGIIVEKTRLNLNKSFYNVENKLLKKMTS